MNKFRVYNLRCLDRKNPQGIDQTPFFSWKLESKENDVYQSAYQICVTDEEKIVWNSGRVESDVNFGIVYEGEALKNGTSYRWTLVCWDNHGNESAKEEASFSTAMIQNKNWEAKWIGSTIEKKELREITDFQKIMRGEIDTSTEKQEILDPPVYFRKEFEIVKPVKKAILYATALGNYVIRLDGKKISNLLAPEYTCYGKHLEYQTYDLTEDLRNSEKHAFGILLSDGWYSGKIGLMGIGHQYGVENALLFQLELTYEDGTEEKIVSDDSVKFALGGYLYADLFVGEYLDQNKIPQGYDLPGFDDLAWQPAAVKEIAYDFLCAQSIDPVHVLKTIKPSLIRTPKGEFVLDAGENICGYTSFVTKTPIGVKLELEHSEVLDHEGNFLQNIMGQNKDQKDIIVTSDAFTAYEPDMTFHGFRYVKLSGFEEVNPEDFTISVLASRMDHIGSFACSDEMLTALQENIMRSQIGNMLCIPTDCPQRERAGWTGDIEVYAPTGAFNMDMRAFLGRWLSDLRIEQREDGQIPNIIPYFDSDKYINGNTGDPHITSAGWGDACILVPYALYRAFADKKVLKENYAAMKAWMGYTESKLGEDYLGWGKLFHFGDWLIPSIMATMGNPIITALQTKEEVALAYVAYDAGRMSEIAEILGEWEDAEYYKQMRKKAQQVFSQTFADENGIMHQQLQGLYVAAIANGMLNETQEAGAVKQLCQLIHDAGDCLDTGFLSIPFLLDTLWEKGEKELAYTLLFQKKAPSWLYAITQGATTIWENWAAILPNGIRTNSSYNHFAFGCVGDFIYRRIGGLQIEEAGYKKVRICPDLDNELSWAQTKYESIYGEIMIRWDKTEEGRKLQVQLPPNTSAVVEWNGESIEIKNGYSVFH